MKHLITFRNRLSWWIYYIFIFGSLLPVGSFFIISSLFSKDRLFVIKKTTQYMNFAFKVARIKIVLHGKENIPCESQGFFIVSNHQSFLDIPIILSKVKIIGFLAKIELAKIPFFKTQMIKSSCVFINRQNSKAIKETVKKIQANVGKGTAYAFFPEGTRTLDGKILPFKSGMLRIAYNSHIPILPLSINSWIVLPKKPRILTSKPLLTFIHPLIYPKEFSDFNTFLDHIKTTIAKNIIQNEA